MEISSRRATRSCARRRNSRPRRAYEAQRSCRRRRFSSARVRRESSDGVARASDNASCFAQVALSASDISRITSCPDATCSRTSSSFACRASCSRSARVFAMPTASARASRASPAHRARRRLVVEEAPPPGPVGDSRRSGRAPMRRLVPPRARTRQAPLSETVPFGSPHSFGSDLARPDVHAAAEGGSGVRPSLPPALRRPVEAVHAQAVRTAAR